MENSPLDQELIYNNDPKDQSWVWFVGAKHDYYLPKWHTFKNGRWVSFNFAAFILGVAWFCYRKMYVEAGIITGIVLLESVITEQFLFYSEPSIAVDRGIQLLYSITIGISANYLYMRSADRKIATCKNEPNLELRQSKIADLGGTTIAGGIIGGLLSSGLVFGLYYFIL